MDRLPLTGEYTTYRACRKGTPALPDYVTDSAASRHRLGDRAQDQQRTRSPSIAGTTADVADRRRSSSWRSSAGFKTGNVTTAELTDATPAVLDSHINDCAAARARPTWRTCPSGQEGSRRPRARSPSRPSTTASTSLLGGGRDRFDQTITGGPFAGKTVIQPAQAPGLRRRTTPPASRPHAGQQVLGLFNPGNMTLEWTGPHGGPSPARARSSCVENQRSRPANEPHLADMTTKAIELLTDDGGHDAAARASSSRSRARRSTSRITRRTRAQQIGETIAFDSAIKVGLDFAAATPTR